MNQVNWTQQTPVIARSHIHSDGVRRCETLNLYVSFEWQQIVISIVWLWIWQSQHVLSWREKRNLFRSNLDLNIIFLSETCRMKQDFCRIQVSVNAGFSTVYCHGNLCCGGSTLEISRYEITTYSPISSVEISVTGPRRSLRPLGADSEMCHNWLKNSDK